VNFWPPDQARSAREDAKQRKERAKYISVKLQAFLWVLAAAGTLYITQFFEVLMSDERVNRYFR
jgi:hypothetical protein